MTNVRGITLADQEFAIKEYEAAYLTLSGNADSTAYAIVTNKRFILTSSTETSLGNSVIVRETKMNDITGVKAELFSKNNFTQIALGIFIVILGAMLLLLFHFIPVSIALMAIGAVMTYKGFRTRGPQIRLTVISNAFVAPINIEGKEANDLFAKHNSDELMSSLIGVPATDTEQLICEIGALITDVQQLGGEATAKKWGTTNMHVSTQPAVAQTSFTFERPAMTAASVVHTNVAAAAISPHAAMHCTCGNILTTRSVFCNVCGKKV